MFKRMSVLVRRPGDSRSFFSRSWEAHAAPVSGLPKVRGYIQNYIEEAFQNESVSPVCTDGFVELLWDKPQDMAAAFASPAARPMIEDEPRFLGHASGYALVAAPPLHEGGDAKLIVVAVSENKAQPLEDLERGLNAMEGLQHIIRDDVARLIPKDGMAPPQRVDAFFHLYFEHTEAARAAGRRIVQHNRPQPVRIGVYRVRTIRFV